MMYVKTAQIINRIFPHLPPHSLIHHHFSLFHYFIRPDFLMRVPGGGRQMFAPLTSCSPDRAECKSITCQGPKEWGHLDGSVFYSWAAPVEWAVLSASTSQMEFNLGSIHCPDCWPLITSKVRHSCWISAGGFMLKGSKRLSGSREIHHQTLETGQRLLAGRSVWTEEDASGAFIRQRRCGLWLRCGSNMLNVRYQVKSVLYRKPQFNQQKVILWRRWWQVRRLVRAWRHFPAKLRREMHKEGRKWFPTAEAVWQSLIMLMFCVVYGRSNWFNWETKGSFYQVSKTVGDEGE